MKLYAILLHKVMAVCQPGGSDNHYQGQLLFRAVFWVVLPCKMIVDNHFTRQYNPENSSEHHIRRHENLKSHKDNC
jgi:hypothetical protein